MNPFEFYNPYHYRDFAAFIGVAATDGRPFYICPQPPKSKNYKADATKKRARKRTQKAKRNNRGVNR